MTDKTVLSVKDWTMTEFWKNYDKTSEEEHQKEADEWFDAKYPNCSCLRCETKLNSKTVKFCSEDYGCETWYCEECLEEGTRDCPCCNNDENCICYGDGCQQRLVKDKSYYLHFPDGTEEWYCEDCQSELNNNYIGRADYRGYGDGEIFSATDSDADVSEDDCGEDGEEGTDCEACHKEKAVIDVALPVKPIIPIPLCQKCYDEDKKYHR